MRRRHAQGVARGGSRSHRVFGIGQPANAARNHGRPRMRLPTSKLHPSAEASIALFGDTSSPMSTDRYDTIVVGAGILGLAVARELLARRPIGARARRRARGVPAARQSSPQQRRDPRRHLLRARLAEGPPVLSTAPRGWSPTASARGVAVRRAGKLIVALRARRTARARRTRAPRARQRRARRPPPRRRGGLREIEPHATGIAAVHAPGTAVVDFGDAVCHALAGDVRADRRPVALRASRCGRRRHRSRDRLRRPTAPPSKPTAPSSARACGRPPRGPRRRGPRSPHRPVSRRLPAPERRAPSPRARSRLPRARSRPPVPRHPPHAHDRRRRPARSVRPARPDAPRPRLARHVAHAAPPRRAPPPASCASPPAARLRRRSRPLRPRASRPTT